MSDKPEESNWGSFARKLKKQVKTPGDTRSWREQMIDAVIDGYYGDYDEAIIEFDYILNNTFENIHKDLRKHVLAYKAIALEELGKNQEALEVYDMGIKLDSKNGIFLANKAKLLTEENRSLEAIPLFQKAIALEDNDMNRSYALANLAEAYFGLEHVTEEAVNLGKQSIEEAMKLNPDDPVILEQYALFLCDVEIEDYEKALEVSEKALIIDPDDNDFKFTKGVIYLNSDKYELALETFLGISESESVVPEYQFNLACCYALLVPKQEQPSSYIEFAIKHLTVAIFLDPQFSHESLEDESFDAIRDCGEFKQLFNLNPYEICNRDI